MSEPPPTAVSPGPQPEARLLDARGLRCPLPVIQLARLVRTLAPGERVRVLADDPAARADLPAWGRMTGHEVREEGGSDNEHTAYLVVVTREGDPAGS